MSKGVFHFTSILTWMSSEIGNWLGMAPSSGSVGPWTIIFFADGTLAVIKMLASTWKNVKNIHWPQTPISDRLVSSFFASWSKSIFLLLSLAEVFSAGVSCSGLLLQQMGKTFFHIFTAGSISALKDPTNTHHQNLSSHRARPDKPSNHCTMQLSLCKVGNWGFRPDSHHICTASAGLPPIFLQSNYFRSGWHNLQGVLTSWLDPEFGPQNAYVEIHATFAT